MTGRPAPNDPHVISPFVPWPPGERLVLASRSPRRAELLAVAGLPFEVIVAGDVEDEVAARNGELRADPARYARVLAEAKAQEVSHQKPGRLVLGADTVVVLDGELLGKPRDQDDALRLLRRLSGRVHTVISAIALVARAPDARWVGHEETRVEFLPLAEPALRRYVSSGEPMDKAGAYGIQGLGALMVRRLEGCYFNVMGLPLVRLGEGLRTILAGRGPAAVAEDAHE
ncbi:MAG: nucleoside triphosphate pyrophosphatase [Candidatus Krumholzibacteriia bacterium]